MATGDVLYHSAGQRPLQDVLAAIRGHATVDALGFRRKRFMDRHLKSPEEMERRFAAFPNAMRRARCNLIENAVTYAGSASVAVNSGGAWIELSVGDHGPDIPPDRIAAMTFPFSRHEALTEPWKQHRLRIV